MPDAARCRRWYARLLRLYPKSHRERFGASMLQTFTDLLGERRAAALFLDTAAGIARERMHRLMHAPHRARPGQSVVAAATAVLLLLPLAAALHGNPAAAIADFALAGLVAFGGGLLYVLASRRAGTNAYRRAAAVALGTALLMAWANGAVGIIGSESNPGNLAYIGVLAVALVGALFARLQPRGMDLAMRATGTAQIIVAGLVAPYLDPRWNTLGVNVAFVLLWALAAWLFRRAALTSAPPTSAQSTPTQG